MKKYSYLAPFMEIYTNILINLTNKMELYQIIDLIYFLEYYFALYLIKKVKLIIRNLPVLYYLKYEEVIGIYKILK